MPGPDASIKGMIKDAKGAAVPGAVIQIPDLKIGTTSDTDGSYELSGFSQGKYLLQITSLSFATKTSTINITADTRQDFVLSESVIERQEVVVTGQSKATEIRRSPVPLIAINSQYLKENLSTNAIDAIAKIPGVTAVTTGPNVSKPFIRGLGYNRVLTLYNGMRQEGQQWGDEHGIEIDEFNTERIEVVKGPASLTYGSDALAGVVNLIPTSPAPPGKTIGNVTTEYQSNNGLFGGSIFASGNKRGMYWTGRLSHKEAANYQDAIDGRVYATGFKETDASAGIGITKNWGYSHLDVSIFNDQQGVPDGSRDSLTRRFTRQITEIDSAREIVSDADLKSYHLPTLHQLVQHYRVQSSSSFHIGEGRLALTLGYQRNVRREYSHPENADIPGLYLQLNTGTYDVKYFFPDFKGYEITAGINGMYQVNDPLSGTEFIIPAYHQFDIGPFAMVKKNLGNLDLSGGIRYDSRTFYNDALYTAPDAMTGFDKPTDATDPVATAVFSDYKKSFGGLSFSIGGTYRISKALSLKANVARGFRAPNIAEISANGVHPGTNIYQLGNTDFKPEFSLQEDVGFDVVTKHLSLSVSFFNNTITNYIYNQKVLGANGADSIIIPGNETFQFRAAKAQLYGFEAELDIHPHPLDWLHFKNAISYVRGLNKGSGNSELPAAEKHLPFIPPLHGYSELRAEIKTSSARLKNLFAKVQLEYWADQNETYTAFNTETRTPGYNLLNAALGVDLVNKKGLTLFSLGVFGNNLTDVAYQSHLSRLKYFEDYPGDPRGHGIYNMGRNVGLRLNVPLRFSSTH